MENVKREYSDALMRHYSDWLDVLLQIDPDVLAEQIKRDIRVLKHVRRLHRKMRAEKTGGKVRTPKVKPVAAVGVDSREVVKAAWKATKGQLEKLILDALGAHAGPITGKDVVDWVAKHSPYQYVESTVYSALCKLKQRCIITGREATDKKFMGRTPHVYSLPSRPHLQGETSVREADCGTA